MPSFSELYQNDPGTMNDAIDASLEQSADDYMYGKGGALDDALGGRDGGGGGGRGGEGAGNSGRGSEMKLADDVFDDKRDSSQGAEGGGEFDDKRDDFNNRFNEKEEEAAPSVPEAEAKPQCLDWKTTYNVQPGIAWSSLPFDLQNKWKMYDCDKWTMDSLGGGDALGF